MGEDQPVRLVVGLNPSGRKAVRVRVPPRALSEQQFRKLSCVRITAVTGLGFVGKIVNDGEGVCQVVWRVV